MPEGSLLPVGWPGRLAPSALVAQELARGPLALELERPGAGREAQGREAPEPELPGSLEPGLRELEQEPLEQEPLEQEPLGLVQRPVASLASQVRLRREWERQERQPGSLESGLPELEQEPPGLVQRPEAWLASQVRLRREREPGQQLVQLVQHLELGPK